MSKQETNAPPQLNMATNPSVLRFSNDQLVSLHVKGCSAKFKDTDRAKSLAPFSNHSQHSPQPSSRPAKSDIVDLRTAPAPEWKSYRLSIMLRCTVDRPGSCTYVHYRVYNSIISRATQPAKPSYPTQRHCSWYSIVE